MPVAIEQLKESHPVFGSLCRTQELVVEQLSEQLGLDQAQADTASDAGAALGVATKDGGAAVSVQAYNGPGVRWLSASTLASPGMGFGGAITAAFADADSDVPHFRLDHKLLGEKVWAGMLMHFHHHLGRMKE
jgi:hypothetical protein